MSDLQWIVIDDTDPRISYSGEWSMLDQAANLESMGQFGAPFLMTSHGTKTNSSLSFSFRGTQLVVAGSQLVPSDPSSFGGACTVDDITQPIIYTTQEATNRVALCRYQNLTDSQHTLVIDAVPAGNKPFWFDYLRYLPTPDVPTINEYMEVLPDNDNLVFDASWKFDAPENVVQFGTNTTNAMMSFSFIGTSIAWYGSYNHSDSLHPADFGYTIDGSDPVVIPILPSTIVQNSITMEQLIFNASGLSPGVIHNLKVTYLGDFKSVPLALNNLVITRGPSSPPPSAHTKARTPHTTIILPIFAAAVSLAGLLIFIIFRRRRQRSARYNARQDISPRPFPVPFTGSQSTPIFQTHRRHSAPGGIVPPSKMPTTPILRPTFPETSQVSGPSTLGLNTTLLSPIDREAVAHVWDLLLRHQQALSNQNHAPVHVRGQSHVGREETSSAHPPAYNDDT